MTDWTRDRGLLLGDGLFETLLWDAGVLQAFDAHVARLVRGCAALDLPAPDPESLITEAVAAIEGAGLADQRAAVRLTWTAGAGGRGLDRPAPVLPQLAAAAHPAKPPEGSVHLATATTRRNDRSPASRLKSLAYLDNVLAREEARRAGADEALMLNTRDQIACAAAANVFWFEGDRLVTPALACGVLDGIVRGLVLETARRLGLEVAEVAAPPSALTGARGVFLTNSLVGVRAVASLDGVAVAPHPLVAALGQPTVLAT